MKDTLRQLRENMEKLLVISDMYDDLLSRNMTSQAEVEEARLRYDYLRRKTLELSAESRRLVKTTEKKDRP